MTGLSGTNLIDYLKKFDRSLCFRPNPGNAGDSIIAHATFQLFRQNRLKFQLFDRKTYRAEDCILISGGGGNLTRYPHAREFIGKYHRGAQKLVILPHTISGNEDLLSQLGGNVEIICRERISYEHVRKHARNAVVLLMEDVAFSLDIAETRSPRAEVQLSDLLSGSLRRASVREAARLVSFLSASLFAKHRYDTRHLSGILNCFRTDTEKTGEALPKGNFDVSARFAFGAYDEVIARFVTFHVLGTLERFQEIHTNRLHIAITAALMGRKVKLYPNNYYKCRAVYDYSMKDRFPNVEWMG